MTAYTDLAILNRLRNKARLITIALIIWEFFSALMLAVANWPDAIIWVNLFLLCLFILIFSVFDSLLLLIVSIPFYVVLPNPYFETLSMWRILFALLFAVWIIKDLKFNPFDRLKAGIKDLRFFGWDKLLGILTGLAIITTLSFAQFISPGLKQVLFWINIYLLYVVLINTVKSRDQIIKIVKYTTGSLLLILALGYLQLLATFFTNLDTFWVYWASFVSKLYYGGNFAEVALYSNSWFSYDGVRQLRMFSIMPDSHSFALIAVFTASFLLPLLVLFKEKKKAVSSVWKNLVLSSLAIALTATRAAWAGILGPFLSALILHFKKIQKAYLNKVFLVLFFVMAFAALLPVFNRGMELIRTGKLEGDFNSRVLSIYNLEGSSNLGRLYIWENSIKSALAKPFGVGLGNFATTVYEGDTPDYGDLSRTKSEAFNLPYEFVTAHSLYLQILVELGFISLIIFVFFVFKYFKTVGDFLLQHKEKNDFLLVLLVQLALAMCWIFTAALFDVTLLNDRILMYFFISLGLSGVIVKNYKTLNE